jgi:hypothetical protein
VPGENCPQCIAAAALAAGAIGKEAPDPLLQGVAPWRELPRWQRVLIVGACIATITPTALYTAGKVIVHASR